MTLAGCPFCGGEWVVAQEPHDNHPVAGMWYLFHKSPRCRLDAINGHFSSKELAVGFWNTRDSDGRIEWRAVPGFEGLYEVANTGEFRSLYFDPPRALRLSKDSNGYPVAMLTKDRKRRPFTAHRLVALAFHADKQNPLHREVAHLDGNRSNCRADNLKWVSKPENMSHKRRHGTAHGSKGNHLRLSLEDAREIVRGKGVRSRAELAKAYGIHPASVSQIWSGARWRAAQDCQARAVRHRP